MRCQIELDAIGTFGASVAHVLRLYLPTLAVTYSPEMGCILDAPLSTAAIHILAVAAPSLADADKFTRVSYAGPSITIPLVLQSHSLWLGPVMGPRRGPCWSCAMRRYNQQGQHTEIKHLPSEDLEDSFPNPLPLASSAILHLIHLSRLALSPVGFVWRMDLKTREIVGCRIVGIHRCARCGLGRKGWEISTKQMSESLSFLHITPITPLLVSHD